MRLGALGIVGCAVHGDKPPELVNSSVRGLSKTGRH